MAALTRHRILRTTLPAPRGTWALGNSDASGGRQVVSQAQREPPIEIGFSARLIIRTASAQDRPGFAEVIQAAYPDLFDRAFGARQAEGFDAVLRLLSEPWQEGTLWVAALDEEPIGAMLVSTHRTPPPDIFKLLGICWSHLGFLQGLWATMTFNPFLSKPSQAGLYINFLAVRPEYQRRRVGWALLQRAIELTMYEGLPQTMTWLPAGATGVLKLHIDLGFSIRRTYRSTLLKHLVGEGEWHYLTRPAAVRLVGFQPVVETAVR